jgi:hypothetical protein
MRQTVEARGFGRSGYPYALEEGTPTHIGPCPLVGTITTQEDSERLRVRRSTNSSHVAESLAVMKVSCTSAVSIASFNPYLRQ